LLALLLLSLSMGPEAPLAVSLVLGALLAVSSFWAAAAALSERERAAMTSTAARVRIILRLTATASAIALGWFIVFRLVASLVS
jgi:hypothetical protein